MYQRQKQLRKSYFPWSPFSLKTNINSNVGKQLTAKNEVQIYFQSHYYDFGYSPHVRRSIIYLFIHYLMCIKQILNIRVCHLNKNVNHILRSKETNSNLPLICKSQEIQPRYSRKSINNINYGSFPQLSIKVIDWRTNFI